MLLLQAAEAGRKQNRKQNQAEILAQVQQQLRTKQFSTLNPHLRSQHR